MKKIFLFKTFEKGERTNESVLTTEFNKLDSSKIIIKTSPENLKEKKEFYYRNLDNECIFLDNKNKSVINVIVDS